MRYPHGLDFIDDETLVVANREGLVTILRLPPGELGGRQCHVEPVREIRGSLFARVRSPGSWASATEVRRGDPNAAPARRKGFGRPGGV